MRVAVTGASGTIGREVVAALRRRGDEVTVLSRDAARARRSLGEGVEAVEWRDPKAGPAAGGGPPRPRRDGQPLRHRPGRPSPERPGRALR